MYIACIIPVLSNLSSNAALTDSPTCNLKKPKEEKWSCDNWSEMM